MAISAFNAHKEKLVLVTCQVIEAELEAARGVEDSVEIRHLDQGLHRTSQKMTAVIYEQIDYAATYATRIVE